MAAVKVEQLGEEDRWKYRVGCAEFVNRRDAEMYALGYNEAVIEMLEKIQDE